MASAHDADLNDDTETDMLDAADVKQLYREQFSRDRVEKGRRGVAVLRGDKWGNRTFLRNRKLIRKLRRSEQHAARNQAREDVCNIGRIFAFSVNSHFHQSRFRF